ncbi:MAG TPA: hypothetical protein VGP92_07760 [Acidimicrobiia bacterium]|jgi:hypothetical protein|nr:hypothetical protein [Acidimicrobiia bacterium]
MFVQVIEGTTSDPAAINAQGDRWQQELRPGAIGYLGVTAGVAADGRTFAVVRFEDEASARANAQRPEQTEWFEEMAKLYDSEPTFTESSDITEWMGGGSNEAGFVQVMKSTGVDRSQVEKMDAAFESFADQRPDLLGSLRIWTGPDRCIDVVYFTSEADARKGEQTEMPAELQELMGEFAGGMGETEYLDLTDPQLR